MRTCKELCSTIFLRGTKDNGGSKGRKIVTAQQRRESVSKYFLGYKYCKRCEYYFPGPLFAGTDNNHCGCCGTKLRSRPANNKCHTNQREYRQVVRY